MTVPKPGGDGRRPRIVRLQMPSGSGSGLDLLGVRAPLGLFLGHPPFPGLAGCRIFTAKGDGHNFLIRHSATPRLILQKYLDVGTRRTRIAVEEISLDRFARGQPQGDVTPVVEGLVDSFGELPLRRRAEDSPFYRFGHRRVVLSVFGNTAEVGNGHQEAFGMSVAFTVRPKPDQEPNVSATAEASYPQCTIQSAQRGFRPVPYWSQSVSSINSLNVGT